MPPNISADLQCEQKAVWHKSCYLNFATSKLDKVRNCKLKRRDYDIYNDRDSDKPEEVGHGPDCIMVAVINQSESV